MTVYISGKIGEAHLSEATRQKFAKAEAMLRRNGYGVFNPTDKSWTCYFEREQSSYEIILWHDLRKLMECDACYMLEDWKSSPGATAEFYYAKATKKKMLFEKKSHAGVWLGDEYNELVRQGRPPLQREEGEGDFDLQRRYIERHWNEVWLPIQ